MREIIGVSSMVGLGLTQRHGCETSTQVRHISESIQSDQGDLHLFSIR
jgi:hypothetical protein